MQQQVNPFAQLSGIFEIASLHFTSICERTVRVSLVLHLLAQHILCTTLVWHSCTDSMGFCFSILAVTKPFVLLLQRTTCSMCIMAVWYGLLSIAPAGTEQRYGECCADLDHVSLTFNSCCNPNIASGCTGCSACATQPWKQCADLSQRYSSMPELTCC